MDMTRQVSTNATTVRTGWTGPPCRERLRCVAVHTMRRVQLVLSEHLDEALSAEARRGGMSRSAAARRLLERALRDHETDEVGGGALLELAGIVDSKGRSDARDVDEVLYGVSRMPGLRRQRIPHRPR